MLRRIIMAERVAVPVVSCRDVKARPDECLVIDVRTAAEFREVHIPGSLNVPLPDLGRLTSELKAQAAGKEMVLICRTGRRATAAAEQLLNEGVTECRVLEGGITSWVEAGLPVNRGGQAVSIERQVRIVAGALVAAGSLLSALVSPWFVVIPALVGVGLVVAGITDTCAMGMLLARLPWNRVPRSIMGEAVCSPRPPEETVR
jgi:rhodanese-related sulfurtransferase